MQAFLGSFFATFFTFCCNFWEKSDPHNVHFCSCPAHHFVTLIRAQRHQFFAMLISFFKNRLHMQNTLKPLMVARLR